MSKLIKKENSGSKCAATKRKCKHCGRDFLARNWMIKKGGGLFCSYECSSLYRYANGQLKKFLKLAHRKGANHSAYKHGNGYGKPSLRKREMATREYREWRKAVLKRDHHQCRYTGKKEKLFVHHIKSWKEHPELRYDVNNGVTVCDEIHRMIHSMKVSK